MDYRIILSRQAESDLEELVRFVAQLDPKLAERTGYGLIDDIPTLERLSNRGSQITDRPGYRRIWHRPWYLIFYRVDPKQRYVEVARIGDARRDPELFRLE